MAEKNIVANALGKQDQVKEVKEEKQKMNFWEKISRLQNELKAPKNLYNSFSKFYYRNAETILENAKPLCIKYGMTLTVFDEVVQIGERYYIKATAQLVDWETQEVLTNSAYAREDDKLKGQTGGQLTGTTSSYARKYALNGLLCIDDTKDLDTDEVKRPQVQEDADYTNQVTQYTSLCTQATSLGIDYRDDQKIVAWLNRNGLYETDQSKMNGTELKLGSDLLKKLIERKRRNG
jgi:hypothetical protein